MLHRLGQGCLFGIALGTALGIALCAALVGCGVEPAVEKTPAVVAATPALEKSGAPKRVSSDELLRELAPRLSRSGAGLVWRKRADGGLGARLEGRFSHATLAQRGADGRLHTTCVESVDAAARVLATPARAGEP